MSVQSGVYEIRNTATGKCYVGSTVNLCNRERQHFLCMEAGVHYNVPLQRAHDKHGSDRLIFRPLIICATDDLQLYEQLLLDAWDPEYNMSKKATHPSIIWTDERRAWFSENNPMKDPEIAEKNTALRRGKTHTDEARKNMSDAAKRRPPNFLGKHHTEETKAKISATLKRKGIRPPRRTKCQS